jgi:hypothetical protein
VKDAEPRDELFMRVRSAFNAVDPAGLLRLGSPEDEYNPEVQDVCRRVSDGEELTPELLRSVLVELLNRADERHVARLYKLLA